MKTNKFISVLLFAMAVSFVSCTPTPKEDASAKEAKYRAAMMEKNKMAVQKVFDAFATGVTDSLGNYVTEDHIDHTPDPNIKTTGLQGLKDAVVFYRAAFPDMKMTVLSMIAEGDMVMAHYNLKGTNSGPMGAMPATNKSFDVNGVHVVKFVNGKGAEHWGYSEDVKMMMQLGMMGEPKADSKKK